MKKSLLLLAVAGLVAGIWTRSADIVLTSTTTHRFEFQYLKCLPSADRTKIEKVVIVHRRYDSDERDAGLPPRVHETETELSPKLVALMPDCAVKTNVLMMFAVIEQVPSLWAYGLTNAEFQAMLLEAQMRALTNQ